MTDLSSSRDEHWCHSQDHGHDSALQERLTTYVLVLTLVTMAGEIVAGMAFGSMALLADGWHMGIDAAAFSVTLFAYRYARAHARDPDYSFGTGKVSVLAGFASAIALVCVACVMLFEALSRLLAPVAIQLDYALLVAAVGLFVNLLSARLLQVGRDPDEHEHHDHNLRSAYLHTDRKSTRLNSSHIQKSRMPSSA